MNRIKPIIAVALTAFLATPSSLFAASHREAPITALDRPADITDWYTFVSYDNPGKVTMILNVDPLLEPSNGPNYFPFDPNILYEMHVDNNRDGVAEDVVFQFRFQTEYRLPGVFTAAVGGIARIPPITALDGPNSVGLNLRQTYSVTMVKNGVPTNLSGGQTLFAVPTNVGPRTMPDYNSLYGQGIYELGSGVRVFAGTVNDPFFIDLGAAFDSLNFRMAAGGGVLSAAVDADDHNNYAPDAVAGFNVNSIVLEVPTTMLTVDGNLHSAGEKEAVIGTYGSTSRRRLTVRRSPQPSSTSGPFQQVQRMGNPLINELIIGIGSKDRWSMDDPENDGQFAGFFLHPLLADIFASFGIPVPSGPRTDLLPLVQYMAPVCPGCGPADTGVIADLLRVNTGIPPTPVASQKRLGFLTLLDSDPTNDDPAGFPNGRRPIDDVTDIAARAVAGILKDPVAFGTRIGDGVNTDGDGVGFRPAFPYVQPALSGRDSHHVGPTQAGCSGYPDGFCPVL
jgi:Domain of unknown function (DUF4331)